jgi:hypothetical protein
LHIARTLPLIGIVLLLGAIVVRFGYERVAGASDHFWSEKMSHRAISAETVTEVMTVARSKVFAPQAERLFIALGQPQDQKGDEYLALSSRVLSRFAQPEAIERHILLLAQAGQVDEAVLHVDRLRVFARETYPKFRDAILEAISDQGAQLEPLRRALRAAA